MRANASAESKKSIRPKPPFRPRAPGNLAGTTRSPITAIAIVVMGVVWYRIRIGVLI
jgi:hypothetical protein